MVMGINSNLNDAEDHLAQSEKDTEMIPSNDLLLLSKYSSSLQSDIIHGNLNFCLHQMTIGINN